MNFKKFIKYLRLTPIKEHLSKRDGLKEKELNRILDKMSRGEEITHEEKEFLSRFDSIKDEEIKDSMLFSKETAYERIKELIDSDHTVICNLTDRDGKIGSRIVDMDHSFDDKCTILTKDGTRIDLKDNQLYNIIFNVSKNEFSLESENEYYEKAPLEK